MEAFNSRKFEPGNIGSPSMKVERTLTVEKWNPNEKGVDLTRDLTGNERVSLVEDLRVEMAKVRNYEYPQRLRRVLEIAHRAEG